MAMPRLLVIAGSDSSAGAGLQADLKTALAFGVYAQTAVTAITVRGWEHPGRLRVLRRTTGLTVGLLLLGIAMFALLNRQLGFYSTWREIGGGW